MSIQSLIADVQKEAASHAACDVADQYLYDAGRDSIPEPYLTVVCVETFYGEVCNGGVEQYLTNNHGVLAYRALDALRKVDLDACADMLQGVLKVLPESLRNAESADDFLEAIEKLEFEHGEEDSEQLLEDLEQPFWDWFNDGNQSTIREKLYLFMKSNRNAFTEDPQQ